jgi:hypothetical protein
MKALRPAQGNITLNPKRRSPSINRYPLYPKNAFAAQEGVT